MEPERVVDGVLALVCVTNGVLPDSDLGPGRGRLQGATSRPRGAQAVFASRPPMMSGTDRELVARVRRGEIAAFGELVARHQRRIHGLATHLLHDRIEAEDVTQETFIRAFAALDRFDGRSEPYTWLYRIAVNLSLNVLRSRRTRGVTCDVDDPRLDHFAAVEGSPDSGATGTAPRQLYEALAAGIDTLSESLRTTLILVCIDGRSHEEASAILGTPEGTIAWRVHEARRKLRDYMARRGFGPEET